MQAALHCEKVELGVTAMSNDMNEMCSSEQGFVRGCCTLSSAQPVFPSHIRHLCLYSHFTAMALAGSRCDTLTHSLRVVEQLGRCLIFVPLHQHVPTSIKDRCSLLMLLRRQRHALRGGAHAVAPLRDEVAVVQHQGLLLFITCFFPRLRLPAGTNTFQSVLCK